jgi:hypothetical protein
MNENHQGSHDPLDEAISAFQRMSVPDRPPDENVLRELGSRQSNIGRPFSILIPSKRRFLMRFLLPSAAAALVLIGGLALFVLNSGPARALDDVVKATEKHKLVKFKEKLTTDDGRGGKAKNDYTVFTDLKASRFRKENSFKFQGDGEKSIEEVGITVTDYTKER